MNIVDLSSESVKETLRINTEKEEYDLIVSSVIIKGVEMTMVWDVSKISPVEPCEMHYTSMGTTHFITLLLNLILVSLKILLDVCKKLVNILFYNGILLIILVLSLDLIDSPSNLLKKRILERTAAVYTSVVIPGHE